MGARPCHRQGRDRDRNPAEPDGPTWTFLEVSYDRAPSNLHQVQPVPLSQCAAWGLRAEEYTPHTYTGNGSRAVPMHRLFCRTTKCVHEIIPCALIVPIYGTIECFENLEAHNAFVVQPLYTSKVLNAGEMYPQPSALSDNWGGIVWNGNKNT